MKKCTDKWKGLTKKKKVVVITVFLAVIIVITGGFVFFKGRRGGNMLQAGSSVQETTAQTGDISNTIVGTGNLELDDTDSITIPSGIIIDEVKVESGDYVSEGDVLAVLNQVSVLSTMESVQEEIEDLDSEINSSKSSSDTETVTAKVSGRVKKIYVEVGSDVADAVVGNGALIVMSIDGEMAVDLDDVSDVSEGDTVTVILSDDTEEEGTVEQISGDTCTVTFTDKNAEIDETVKVKTEDGASVGRGSAYIHQKLEVIATSGTVSKIHVDVNDTVSSGTTLLTLTTDGQSAKYQKLVTEREELAQILQKLVSMSKTGTITADKAGTIGSVNVSAGSSTSGSTGSSAGGSMSYDTESSSGETKSLAFNTKNTGITAMSSVQTKYTALKLSQVSEDLTETGTNQSEGSAAQIKLQIVDSGTSSQTVLVLEPPKTGNTPQMEITATDGSYTGKVTWTPADSVFAGETTYQADIILTASDDYIFESDSITQVQTGLLSGVTVSDDKKTLTFHLTFSETEEDTQAAGNETTGHEQSNSGTQAASNQSDTQTSGNSSDGNGNTSGKTSGSQSTGASATVSSGSSSQSASSSGSGTDDSSDSTEVTAFTLASDDSMLLSVSVDELDINSIALDQEAEITLDAIEDETFSGTVVKVGNSASSASGGVAKYSVQISIPKTEEMKAGMNASATIVIENKENVVTIPVTALQERGNKVFVYTEKDSDGNLSGEQEVTTGLSDGDMVEITEGLSEGDVVYYQKTGSSSSNQSLDGKPDMGSGSDGFPGGGDGGDFKGGGSSGGPGEGRGGMQ